MRRRRRGVGKLEPDIVEVAEVPLLSRLVRPDDGMPDRAEMLGGVLARRLIAAADVPALLADAQMDPVVPAGGEALDAAGSRGRDVVDLVEVGADGPAQFPASFGSQPMRRDTPAYVVSRKSWITCRGSGLDRVSS